MKSSVVFVVLCVLFVFAGVSISNGVVHDVAAVDYAVDGDESIRSPARRSLLSFAPKQEVELVAAPNGTVYLVDSNSRKALWSFPSGPPIYSSYHASFNQDGKDKASGLSRYLFLDCGDDWALYLVKHTGRQKLGVSVEDYVNSTPIFEDGRVTLGSMHSSLYTVDPWTGKLLSNYGHSGVSMSQESGVTSPIELEKSSTIDLKTSDVELCVNRKDYVISTYASDKLQWNLTVAVFTAGLRLRSTEKSPDGLDSGSVSHVSIRRFRYQSTFESFLRLGGLQKAKNKHNMLPMDDPNETDPSPPEVSTSRRSMVSYPSPSHVHTSLAHLLNFRGPAGGALVNPSSSKDAKFSLHSIIKNPILGLRLLFWEFVPLSVFLLVLILVGYTIHLKYRVPREKSNLNLEPSSPSQPLSSRKRRTRKSTRSIIGIEEGQYVDAGKQWLNLNNLVNYDSDGRVIGRLFISSIEIAKGSNGTVIFEGIYEGRKVAVKRLVQAHHDVAVKEIQHLITSDQHPNIVRWYGVEYDQDFVYLSLERCTCNLNDLVESLAGSSQNVTLFQNLPMSTITEYRARLNSVKGAMQDTTLWKSNGCPSTILLKLMRDLVSGLVHLHELGIIHRDIKPQNVLIIKERTLIAKLSDMGISKRLPADMSSLGHQVTGHGSSGWQAPEQLLHGRQTRAVDMFSLGCVLFFCVSGGRHPFGDRFERDANIIKNKVDLFVVEHIPEAVQLINRLLQPDPQMRPKAAEVLHHPFFWNSETRLSFLHDASDRVELEDREAGSDILKALESIAPTALGAKWDEKMDLAFINNIGHYRRYKYDSVRDLLRVIRNKLNHYRELPLDIQRILGPVPEGFDEYFRSRFPRLLIEVYKVMFASCISEKWFLKYYQPNLV